MEINQRASNRVISQIDLFNFHGYFGLTLAHDYSSCVTKAIRKRLESRYDAAPRSVFTSLPLLRSLTKIIKNLVSNEDSPGNFNFLWRST